MIGAARRGFFSQASGIARNVAVTAAEKAIDDALHQSKQRKLLTLRDRLGAGKSGKLPTFQPERNLLLLDELWKIAQRRADAQASPDEPDSKAVCSFPVAFAEEFVDTRLFGSIEIDPTDCSGCGMCVMFCPTAALKYSATDEPDDVEARFLGVPGFRLHAMRTVRRRVPEGQRDALVAREMRRSVRFRAAADRDTPSKKGNFLFTRNNQKR